MGHEIRMKPRNGPKCEPPTRSWQKKEMGREIVPQPPKKEDIKIEENMPKPRTQAPLWWSEEARKMAVEMYPDVYKL